MRQYFVYMMASRSRTLYVGMTNDLPRRVLEHKQGRAPGFTSRYRIERLVFAESTADVREALRREKQIKGWSRAKKIELIEAMNPTWKDLAVGWEAAAGDLQIPRVARDDKGRENTAAG